MDKYSKLIYNIIEQYALKCPVPQLPDTVPSVPAAGHLLSGKNRLDELWKELGAAAMLGASSMINPSQVEAKPKPTVTHSANVPKGVINNNPGNLKKPGKDDWDGATGYDNNGFAIFKSPYMGIRALTKLLSNYYNKQKLDTVTKIIGRYAPATENPTSAYIVNVSNILGVQPTEKINLNDYNTIHKLIKGILKQEIGHEHANKNYSDSMIKYAIRMIIKDPVSDTYANL